MNWKTALLIILIVLPVTSAQAQRQAKSITFTGSVIDGSGNPIPNVMFFVDDIKITATTKQDGSFKFKVKPTTKKIMVYSMANGGKDLEYSGELTHIFILDNALEGSIPLPSKEMGETVNVGYDIAKKEDLTTSVGSVDVKTSENMRYSTIYEMIAGQVPGVTVSGSSIRIRGQSSINGGNEPLFVVDGTAVGSVSNINPSDVESIDILKGSSTAIYGTRGANGVIIIKTKAYNRK